MKKRSMVEDNELKAYDILVEAKGEQDFYDKCILIAEVEHCYDKEKICKKEWNDNKVMAVRNLTKEFIKDFAIIKDSK